ncbi:DNA repair protein RadA [Vibrio parahaemolyticus]|nr:DNA repair protein RadA [Vibrio parahaemolyticus]EJC6753980.1 DNA repair protein RadA [Vibrio parahaemolyticus]EJC6771524.1 DNA repair protein RadA [Vibrio parahaemolyticus]EJC6786404.1 DNA repair protein RadA [Vibrio parahaemolyticus]EJC6892181.1 DNA repair protein RadA [Vibrio parahaemolyticus]
MAKNKMAYLCSECGYDSVRWVGQCPGCKAWNTMSEFRPAAMSKTTSALNRATGGSHSGGYAGSSGKGARKLDDVSVVEANRVSTGQSEFDRVLGGGLTLGSVVLASGDPGAGKTTLLTQIAAYMSQSTPTMYVTAEESLSQWKKRAQDRLGLEFNSDNFWVDDSDCAEDIVAAVKENGIKLLIADSIQAFESTSVEGSAGGVTQVKTCAQILNRLCKTEGITLILVGQVNKDSKMAGPQTLKHIIDTTVHIDVTESNVRILRSDKNRFGDTDQVGIFQMTERGMVSVDNPSRLFLSGSEERYEGSAVTVIKDGARNLLIEVQALATDFEGEKPLRNCIGVSYSRLALITAVLKKHGGINTYYDINISLVGGLKMADTETSTDLAVMAALISSINSRPTPEDSVFIGEVALTGEIRQVQGGVARVREAAKHGKKLIFLPKANYHNSMLKDLNPDQKIIPVAKIADVIKAL